MYSTGGYVPRHTEMLIVNHGTDPSRQSVAGTTWQCHDSREPLRCAPVWVEEDEAVATDEVDAAAARLGGQQEHKLAGLLVEMLHHLGALLQRRRPVQPQRRILHTAHAPWDMEYRTEAICLPHQLEGLSWPQDGHTWGSAVQERPCLNSTKARLQVRACMHL